MTLTRYRVDLTTDTGGNDADVTAPVHGVLRQVLVTNAVATFDTGAKITITADTGNINSPVLFSHIGTTAAATWRKYPVSTNVVDTGGAAVASQNRDLYFVGERMSVTMQADTGDTGAGAGRDMAVMLYVDDLGGK